MLLALVLAAVVVIAGGTTYALSSQGEDSSTPAVATDSPRPAPAAAPSSAGRPATQPATSPSLSPTPTPTVDPEAAALGTLDQLRRASLVGLRLDDRWVAQVASKSVGITDPLQTAANGTHTFYATDILAEVNSMQSLLAGTPVLVLQSVDFGRYSVDAAGQPYWVTIADAGFADADAVDLWCARTFPTLSSAELANACAPRTLGPSHP